MWKALYISDKSMLMFPALLLVLRCQIILWRLNTTLELNQSWSRSPIHEHLRNMVHLLRHFYFPSYSKCLNSIKISRHHNKNRFSVLMNGTQCKSHLSMVRIVRKNVSGVFFLVLSGQINTANSFMSNLIKKACIVYKAQGLTQAKKQKTLLGTLHYKPRPIQTGPYRNLYRVTKYLRSLKTGLWLSAS